MGYGRTLITVENGSAHLVDVYEEFFVGGISDTSSLRLKASMVNSLNFIVSYQSVIISINL